ncbi:synaptonemal complex central element protein 1 isoform X2 [Hyla sarda]|nr:synaptonemal complex central element protein 1 isoform X2 [Hyla sarda]XP_056394487.1 synaptonemal complex central element protein 1 isoform X2 [Hyla sarda]XP_056394489.1 synaptonemal complex central element protein 1 isoform X2 [Hyla sarda]XP_056394490.1 synaptonemal complex central element protein 1 isoform X2 [Hyla sarda]XP_056394491.1 synaptonemal complex central element protein 1 isoform X2 [Hyla sarda]XP_056394492.1 synaptonemal complex central element protein 1 isoform X2 [Hyla sarda]
MEALLRQAEDLREAGNMDPKMEEVLKKISAVQKDREQAEAEKQTLDQEIEAAQSELQNLYTEKAALKEIAVKKQETIQNLKLRRDKQLKKEKKQQEQAEETEKRMEDLTTKIEEEKMKQRKQRIEFQDQTEEMIKRHKNLAQFYDTKRLEAEIEGMKEQKRKLLQEEKVKLTKLKELEETEAKLRADGVLTSENLFLRSEQATCTIELFEEENKCAKARLEEVTARQTEALNKYNELKSCLEDAEKKLPKVLQAPSNETQPEISKGPGLSSSIL